MTAAIWESFVHSLADSAPALGIGLVLSAAVQALGARSRWTARALTWVARSVPGAALAGAVLPGCAMTTVPLAIPLKRQGARDGALLAFIITSALLGPASIILTFALFGPVWGILRIVLPFAAVCLLGWALNAREPAIETVGDHPVCASACGCGSSGQSSGFGRLLLRMAQTLVPLFLLGLLAAATVSVLIGKEDIARWMTGGLLAYAVAAGAGIPAYVCEGGEVPLTAALVAMGVGAGPAFTFMQAAVGTCLPTLMMLPRLIGIRLTTIYLGFWLVYSIGSGLLLARIL